MHIGSENSIKKSAKFKVTAVLLIAVAAYLFWLIPVAFINIYGIDYSANTLIEQSRQLEQTAASGESLAASQAGAVMVAEHRKLVDFLLILLYNGSASVVLEFGLIFLLVRYTYQEQLRRQRLDQEFIAQTSHELRTPLTAIRGYVSMAMEGDLSAKEQQTALEQANTSTQQLSVLVERLLEVARLEHQEMHYRQEPMSPAKIVEVAMSTVAEKANRKNVKVAVTNKLGQSAGATYGDTERWVAAVAAVLQNAIQYSHPQSEVAVVIGEKDGRVRLTVTDHGVGISAQNQRRIFEKFYREHNMYSDGGGVGIGLYVARKIIKQQKGMIELSSELKQGTTVTVSLPAPGSARSAAGVGDRTVGVRSPLTGK